MSKKDHSFFERIIKKLFPEKKEKEKEAGTSQKKGTNVPIHNEPIHRTEDFNQEMQEWLNKAEHIILLRSIHQAYKTRTRGAQPLETELFIHRSPYANGMFFTYKDEFGIRPFSFLFDLLKDRALELGYRVYHSDRRILEQSSYYETIERHYLKPPLNKRMDIEKGEQLYGNLSIEHDLINDHPSYIKVMANVYSDSKFKEPLPFEDLIEKLLGPEDH